jgi:hypothetical protein
MEAKLKKMEKQLAQKRYLTFSIFDYLMNQMCVDFLF